MAGAPGFEPGNGDTKNRCLTTWPRPNNISGTSPAEQGNNASPSQLQRLLCALLYLVQSYPKEYYQNAKPLTAIFLHLYRPKPVRRPCHWPMPTENYGRPDAR